MDFELTPEELALFLEEAREQLETMEESLLSMESSPDDPALIQELFRIAHTLKGGAATAGFGEVAALTHAMESLMDVLRRGELPVTESITDRLLEAVDLVRRALAIAATGGTDSEDEQAALPIDQCIERLDAVRTQTDSGEVSEGEVGGAGDETGVPAGDAVFSGDTAPLVNPTTVTEYVNSGYHVLRWSVSINPEAAMASVRAYQVLMELEECGQILASQPTAAQIESEEADCRTVRAVVAHDRVEETETALKLLAGISDVTAVEHALWTDLHTGVAEAPGGAGGGESEAAVPRSGPDESKSAMSSAAPPRVAPRKTVRVSVDLLDKLMNLVGELVIDRTRLAQVGGPGIRIEQVREDLTHISGHLSRIISELQDAVMQSRMMPLETLFKKFPRMMRDLSKKLGKSVEFAVSGEETELDRSVIEQIGDPLMHLLRNAVDHGLETEAERTRAGKPPTGHVRLAASHRDSHIYIEISDDGPGIDPDVIRTAAVGKGVVSQDQVARMSDAEAVELIFSPGFSTASAVSSVSGRGVGMDVVRRNIEKVNGNVGVDTEVGRGTTFTIQLPLTLAILQALMVEIAGGIYAVPLSSVVEAVRVRETDISWARGRRMISVRKQMTPLMDPGEIWGPGTSVPWRDRADNSVVVVQSGGAPLGVRVDRLLGEQEVVIKNMGPIIGDVPGLSGASILGDGRVALIVDVVGLIKEVRAIA